MEFAKKKNRMSGGGMLDDEETELEPEGNLTSDSHKIM